MEIGKIDCFSQHEAARLLLDIPPVGTLILSTNRKSTYEELIDSVKRCDTSRLRVDVSFTTCGTTRFCLLLQFIQFHFVVFGSDEVVVETFIFVFNLQRTLLTSVSGFFKSKLSLRR